MDGRGDGKVAQWHLALVGTVGAALIVLYAVAALVPAETAAVAAAVDPVDPQASRTSAEGPSPVRRMAAALEESVKGVEGVAFVDESVPGIPLGIVGARLKPVPAELYKATVGPDGLEFERHKLVVDGKVHAAFVRVENHTAKAIRAVRFSWPAVGEVVVMLGNDPIGPGETRLLENLAVTETWDAATVGRVVGGERGVALVGFLYADGTTWGMFPKAARDMGPDASGLMVYESGMFAPEDC